MRRLVLSIALICLAAQHAYAAGNKGATLNCGSLNVPIDSIYLELANTADSGLNSSQFVSVTTELGQFDTLFLAYVSQRHFSDCYVLQPGQRDDQGLRLTDVFIRLVSISADAKSRYVSATFDFGKIEIPAGSAAASTSSTKVLTPEQRDEALTEFLARAPKPSRD